MTTAVPHSELDKLTSERDQARGIAVKLEQENARLTAVIGHLMTNAMNVSEHEAWTRDVDALMAGSLDITEMSGWTALRFTYPARGGDRVSWHLGPLAGFDLETTGVNVEADRIVTASARLVDAQAAVDPEDEPRRWLAITPYDWMSDADGVEIPEGASKVHGITTAQARTEGRPAARVVKEIGIVLAEQVAAGVPLVVMNAPYDLTMLDRELQRHGYEPLAVQAGREPIVVDPLVIDKAADRYRSGKRTLTALCGHYGVELSAAHDAGADARAAMQVAVAIAEKHPALQVDALQLHQWQQLWAKQQADSLREYLAAKGRDASTVHGHWPLIPRQGGNA